MDLDLNLNLGLARHLGMKFLEATPERVLAELEIREEVCTLGGAIHGGSLMALADTAGAVGTLAFLEKNPDAGKGTATLESKTNFFAAAMKGSTVRAEATPLHKGKRTHVWQTRITREDGRLVSLTIQTQMIL